MPRFYLHNFGCRATQADGYAMVRQLAARGLTPAESAEEADVVIFNTCTVTSAADQDARAAIRRAHRLNPNAQIMVTGCYAQRSPEEVSALPGVAWVVGNSHKHLAADIAAGASVASSNFVSSENLALSAPAFSLVGDIFAHTELLAAPVLSPVVNEDGLSGRTRPNLKVQDGCNNRCSFCIIPSVRGRSRSLDLNRAIAETNALVSTGYREMVLTGINLGRWGRDFAPPQRFEQLLRALLDETAIEKIRISSVEPMDWTDELISLVAGSPRLAQHAHVPLQSGSDRILRAMHRRYRPWHYAEKIRKIREAMPDAAIGADVMVGFPGESDELFEESRSFIEHLPFTYLHVFTYSSRPGTTSAAMPGQVPVQVARERNRILREMAARKNQDFRSQFVGRELEVITLQDGDGDSTAALTDNYLKVRLQGRHAANSWIKIEVTEIDDEGLVAVAQEQNAILV